ncbi:MAG: erythromycin esterase family protein [Bacteroidota bacterium]
MSLISLNVFSQNFKCDNPNLDFEIVDGNKALGWGDFGNEDYIKGIDTIAARSGKNSAFIESKDEATTFGALSFDIPADFVGKKLKLTGYIKTEEVTEGFAGLWMRIDPKVAFYNMADIGVKGTTEWQKYEIELDYEVRAEKIVIGGLLAGKGKMWIDDLEITIDGKKIETAEKKVDLTPEVKESLVNQIAQNKIALDLSSDLELEASLQSLIESIGDKKIVAIGEDTHGTSEYYRLREAITKKLILEKGFNVVVLENPYDDIEMLGKDIHQEKLEDLMRKHLFSIYQTREMNSFLDWYKTNGSEHNVQFKGCDDSYWVLQEILEQQLSTLNDDKIKSHVKVLKDAAALSIKKFNRKYKISGKKASSGDDLGVFTYQAALNLEEALSTKGLLTKELEEYLFNIKTSYINYLHLSKKRPIQTRDEMMAKRIAWFAAGPDAKIVVWAHNAHISNEVVLAGEIGLMGHNLKKGFGDAYHSIGMSSLKGSYSYIENPMINNDHSYDDKLLKADLNFQPNNSWEKIFSEIDEKAFYFETKEFADDQIFENLKLLGYPQEKDTDYYKLSPLKMFDTVFFIESTNATHPLFN